MSTLSLPDAFNDYVHRIGITHKLLDRFTTVYAQAASLTSESIKDLFVTDYRQLAGESQYATAVFFTENTIIEIQNFLALPLGFFIASDLGRPSFCQLTPHDFDISQSILSTGCHRLQLIARWMPDNFELNLHATDENCQHLLALAKKRMWR